MGGRFFKGCRFARGGREVVFFQTTPWWKGFGLMRHRGQIFIQVSFN